MPEVLLGGDLHGANQSPESLLKGENHSEEGYRFEVSEDAGDSIEGHHLSDPIKFIIEEPMH